MRRSAPCPVLGPRAQERDGGKQREEAQKQPGARKADKSVAQRRKAGLPDPEPLLDAQDLLDKEDHPRREQEDDGCLELEPRPKREGRALAAREQEGQVGRCLGPQKEPPIDMGIEEQRRKEDVGKLGPPRPLLEKA